MIEEAVRSASIGETVKAAARRLRAAGIAGAERDARMLMLHCLGVDTAGLIAVERDAVPDDVANIFEQSVVRRQNREPVARIVGTRAFFGRQIAVDAHVLDPRPETEILVEQVLADFPDEAGKARFADIGTGSGAIALSILVERPEFRAVGVDISGEALNCARANARSLGVASRFETVVGDMVQPLSGVFDFIVANPPYIATDDIAGLEPEVREFDPALALDGGKDGLSAYRDLLAHARAKLAEGGRLYLEAGLGQVPAIRHIVELHGWGQSRMAHDLGGVERVLVIDR